MAAFGYNFNLQFQNTTNNVLEESNQSCTAITNIDISNDQFIITGNNIGGNLNLFLEGASTDASCSMVSTMETSVTNILKSTLSQKNASSSNWFSGINECVNAAVGIQNIETLKLDYFTYELEKYYLKWELIQKLREYDKR